MTEDRSPASPVLAISDCEDAAAALGNALRQAGLACAGESSGLDLGQFRGDGAPNAVIVHWHGDAGALVEALRPWQGVPPCPVCVIAARVDAAAARALAEAGAHHWSDVLQASALRAALGFAGALFERQQVLRLDAARARDQLDDRKWVDRAKGVLMGARGFGEDDAFALLRSMAMHANLKLADVARSVVDAARWAEAVNRSGQLRMLSQRVVSAAAQRLVRVDAASARKVQQQALARARENLAHLAQLPLSEGEQAALDETTHAWRRLASALDARLDLGSLQAADAAAQTALRAAEALTLAVQAQGARQPLHVIDLCGRQRMHAQRLVKQGLLAMLGAAPDAAIGTQELARAFSDGLAQVESLPLDSPDIREALAASKEAWLQMLRAVRASDPAGLVHAGQHLLDRVEHLTLQCEHSLHVLMA
jgi:AmiR/NasT family two-component response regulator